MRSISFRTLLTGLLFVGFIPLLLLIGLIVYGFQRTYLMEQAKSQLSSFIRVEIENLDPNSNLSLLAVQTGERIRPLGADLFIKDKDGNPVPPALGTGPWLEDEIHKNALIHQKAQFLTIHTDSGDRLVFLSPILSSEGMALGTLESSISLSGIQTQLLVLQRWLILLIGFSIFLVGIISQGISTFSLRPIQNLVKTAEKVREGDLHTRASTTSIIEINELAFTLNQMLTRLEEDIDAQRKLNQTMRQFAADASHELRSPLMVFNNSVDLLRKFVEEKNFLQMIEILNVLEREVQTMSRLVDNLLLLARLDQAQEDPAKILRVEEIEPLPLIEEIYERAKLLSQGQRIVMRLPSKNLKSLTADRSMLTHALNNLIENAIQHTPPEKGIFITAESEERYCIFVIQDEGTGIPKNQIPFIFDRFYRVDTSRSQRKSGAGLGLAIVQSIVHLHQGKIEVFSDEGKGTTFKVFIPYGDE